MIPGSPAPELRVPLERLQRLKPLRTWNVDFEASRLKDGDVPLQVGDVSVIADKTIRVELVLDQTSEGVMVAGVVSTTWSGDCSRCLRPVEGTATAEVEELFEEHPREGESYLLHEEFIDLEPMVRDAILLELPVGVVRCLRREECSDLSLKFLGAMDEEGDSEASAVVDPRWAPLEALVFDEEEGPRNS